MHGSSLRNMNICVQKYVEPLRETVSRKLRVVDIGSVDVNGSYRQLFDPELYEYVGIDMTPGKGVDLVISDPYKIPITDSYADIVLSGQMLEHNEFFWLTFAEKARIVNGVGYILMIAPSAGPIHRFPVDCYRFYPDAYTALAKYTHSILIDCWFDRSEQWHDLIGVFVKHYRRGISVFDTSTMSSG